MLKRLEEKYGKSVRLLAALATLVMLVIAVVGWPGFLGAPQGPAAASTGSTAPGALVIRDTGRYGLLADLEGDLSIPVVLQNSCRVTFAMGARHTVHANYTVRSLAGREFVGQTSVNPKAGLLGRVLDVAPQEVLFDLSPIGNAAGKFHLVLNANCEL